MVVQSKQCSHKFHNCITSFSLNSAGLLFASMVSTSSMMLMPVQSQAADSFEDSKLAFSRSKMSEAELANELRRNQNLVKSTRLFIDCSQIHNEAARLACYDKVVSGSDDVGIAKQKKQLDLGKTFQSALSGKPKIVVDDPNAHKNQQHLVDDSQVIEVIDDNRITPENKALSAIAMESLKRLYKNRDYGSYSGDDANQTYQNNHNQSPTTELVNANVKQVTDSVVINQGDTNINTDSTANIEILKKFYANTNHQVIDQSKNTTAHDAQFNHELHHEPHHIDTAKNSVKSIKQTDNSNYFLNTEVVRNFYTMDEYTRSSKPESKLKSITAQRQSTNFDKQNLSKLSDTRIMSQSLYHSSPDSHLKNNMNMTSDESGKYSALSLAYDLDVNDEAGTWRPRPHNPMYLLPLFMHDNPNRSPSTPNQPAENYTQNDYRSPELKFQISFKSKVAQDLFNTDADLWLGYTQQSHWQVYNEDNSRPFRAHDYMPELFLTQPVKASLPFGGRLRMLGTGFVHHSNGEDDPLSRSWNRAYVMAGAEWDKLTIMPRLWARLNTDTGSKPDDNPDIEEYYGYGDLKVFYDLDEGKSVAGTFRINPSTGKGAAQLDYIYPMDNNVNLYFNLFHGYGESIIDYNHEDTSVGIGVMLNDWRGL